MKTPALGTVSHGTLRTADLMEAFAKELDCLAKEYPQAAALVRDAEDLLDSDHDLDEHEWAGELVNDLQDCLNELAPSFCYFGTLEGDGSDFGFWPDMEAIEMAVHDGEVLKVSDLSEMPENLEGSESWDGTVIVVTDHGNATLGVYDGYNFKEIWSIV